jgi:hypothetical protein
MINKSSVFSISKKISLVSAMGVLLAPTGVFADTNNNETEPDRSSVAYWCANFDGGVKFNTTTIGVYNESPIKITIVDETPDRVSDIVADNNFELKRVIVAADNNLGDGYGNNDYDLPTTESLTPPIPSLDQTKLAPTEEPTKSTDIKYVIVCYDEIEAQTDSQPAVLGANTDSGPSVLGAETLQDTGIATWIAVIFGIALMAISTKLFKSPKYILKK